MLINIFFYSLYLVVIDYRNREENQLLHHHRHLLLLYNKEESLLYLILLHYNKEENQLYLLLLPLQQKDLLLFYNQQIIQVVQVRLLQVKVLLFLLRLIRIEENLLFHLNNKLQLHLLQILIITLVEF